MRSTGNLSSPYNALYCAIPTGENDVTFFAVVYLNAAEAFALIRAVLVFASATVHTRRVQTLAYI